MVAQIEKLVGNQFYDVAGQYFSILLVIIELLYFAQKIVYHFTYYWKNFDDNLIRVPQSQTFLDPIFPIWVSMVNNKSFGK